MKVTFYVCLALAAFVVQTTSFHFMPWLRVYPDIMLALAIHGGMRWGKIDGFQFGAAIGFFQDLLSYGVLGMNLLSKSLISFIVGALREKYINDSLITRIALVVSSTILDLAIYRILYGMLIGNETAWFDSKAVAAQCLVNLVFTLAALPIIMIADRAIDRHMSHRLNATRGQSFLD
jgi:rod shape-determining protein MreD